MKATARFIALSIFIFGLLLCSSISASAQENIAVVVNQKNDWAQCLTVEELRQIWSSDSDVQNWNDVRSSFSDQPMELYALGKLRYAYAQFVEPYLEEDGSGRAGIRAHPNASLFVQRIQGNRGALGFLKMSEYEKGSPEPFNVNMLKMLEVRKGGNCNQSAESAHLQTASPPVAETLGEALDKAKAMTFDVVSGFNEVRQQSGKNVQWANATMTYSFSKPDGGSKRRAYVVQVKLDEATKDSGQGIMYGRACGQNQAMIVRLYRMLPHSTVHNEKERESTDNLVDCNALEQAIYIPNYGEAYATDDNPQ